MRPFALCVAICGLLTATTAFADSWIECNQRANEAFDQCLKQVGNKPIDRARCENEKERRLLECKNAPVDDDGKDKPR